MEIQHGGNIAHKWGQTEQRASWLSRSRKRLGQITVEEGFEPVATLFGQKGNGTGGRRRLGVNSRGAHATGFPEGRTTFPARHAFAPFQVSSRVAHRSRQPSRRLSRVMSSPILFPYLKPAGIVFAGPYTPMRKEVRRLLLRRVQPGCTINSPPFILCRRRLLQAVRPTEVFDPGGRDGRQVVVARHPI